MLINAACYNGGHYCGKEEVAAGFSANRGKCQPWRMKGRGYRRGTRRAADTGALTGSFFLVLRIRPRFLRFCPLLSLRPAAATFYSACSQWSNLLSGPDSAWRIPLQPLLVGLPAIFDKGHELEVFEVQSDLEIRNIFGSRRNM